MNEAQVDVLIALARELAEALAHHASTQDRALHDELLAKARKAGLLDMKP